MGVAYVGFAVRHQAHFEVMFRPELYHADDPEVSAARERASRILTRGVENQQAAAPERSATLAAWSMAHGFANLWLSGALPDDLPDTPDAAARPVLRVLFQQ